MHLDVSRASVRLIRERLKPADVTDEHDGFLDDLIALEDGSMPCDGSWPADRIATFRKWIDDGKRP